MAGLIIIEDEDVVEIGEGVGDAAEDGVYQTLERLRGVGHAHAESPEIEHAPGCGYTGLLPVVWMDQDLVKGFPEVHLREDPGAPDQVLIPTEVW